MQSNEIPNPRPKRPLVRIDPSSRSVSIASSPVNASDLSYPPCKTPNRIRGRDFFPQPNVESPRVRRKSLLYYRRDSKNTNSTDGQSSWPTNADGRFTPPGVRRVSSTNNILTHRGLITHCDDGSDSALISQPNRRASIISKRRNISRGPLGSRFNSRRHSLPVATSRHILSSPSSLGGHQSESADAQRRSAKTFYDATIASVTAQRDSNNEALMNATGISGINIDISDDDALSRLSSRVSRLSHRDVATMSAYSPSSDDLEPRLSPHQQYSYQQYTFSQSSGFEDFSVRQSIGSDEVQDLSEPRLSSSSRESPFTSSIRESSPLSRSKSEDTMDIQVPPFTDDIKMTTQDDNRLSGYTRFSQQRRGSLNLPSQRHSLSSMRAATFINIQAGDVFGQHQPSLPEPNPLFGRHTKNINKGNRYSRRGSLGAFSSRHPSGYLESPLENRSSLNGFAGERKHFFGSDITPAHYNSTNKKILRQGAPDDFQMGWLVKHVG
eukprot:CAMPEP_0185257402 /NCGR_PEP_ID=MMETSP1359-20130426/6463_1 /TAXON_ID=552665 /ORGANISM="Bigelowiella longifila, Strain CCMP242" /LENGTH=495 /DNA_ID=CAMNT_0027842473 /DNA_START=120 /DNA_END=1608 /DNA_ORIENTATION=+